MFGVPIGFDANGNIAPMRFVKADTSVAGSKILQAAAGSAAEGDETLGISAQWQHNLPWYPTQDGYIATAGKNCATYLMGQICLLSIAGTIAFGDPIKSDANGKGIKADTDKDRYGAIAMESGVTGKDIKVLVVSPNSTLSI